MLVKSPLLHTSKQFSEFLFFYYIQVIFLHEVCVCVYVYVYICMYVYIYTYLYIHIYTSQMCVYVCVCVCTSQVFPGIELDIICWHQQPMPEM